MKLIDALKDVVKTAENSTTITYDDQLKEALHIDSWNIDSNKFEKRFMCYWVYYWICTDSYVGLTAMYLDNELVGYTEQSARKAPLEIRFINEAAAIKVRDWYKECLMDEEDKCEFPLMDADDFGFEITDTRFVPYANQLLDLDKKGWYKGERATQFKPAHKDKYVDMHHIIKIDATGETITVPANELTFPIHVNSLVFRD